MVSTLHSSSLQIQLIRNIAIVFLLISALILSSTNVALAKGSDSDRKVSIFWSQIFGSSRVAYALESTSRTTTRRTPRVSRNDTPVVVIPVTPTTPTQPTTGPVAAPAPDPTQQTSNSSFASEVQQKIIEYTNAERSSRGLKALKADTKLAAIAQAHSADMLANNFFSHTNKSGCDPKCRIDAAKYAWQSYGENIYWMSGYTQTPSEAARMVVDGWMNSTGHRANILNTKFTNIGVGVAVQGTKVYTTADYTLPK